MVRIIYRWRVKEQNQPLFQQAWSLATNQIHQTVPGALGSFMLQDANDKNLVLTVAKWQSLEHWQAFWGLQPPEQMQQMHQLAERIGTEVYQELEDFTR